MHCILKVPSEMEVTPRYKLLRGLRGVWFEQHGNRLYGVMGLLSKKWSGVGEWIEWIPLRLL